MADSGYGGATSDVTAKDEERIIAEIQSRYDYASREWEDIRNEGRIDMRYVAGEVWEPKERRIREDAKRPCLDFDELSQYVNQLINEVRQHKRSIKVTPVGNKSQEPIARLRSNLIRQIEYRSNAQIAYTTMFENAVQRSYGFLRIKPRYEHVRSFHQELIIEPFQNPDMVTPDPDDLSPVGADMKFAFIHEWWNMGDFRRRWPNAKVKGADKQWQQDAPKWWRKDRIQVAEYWAVEPKDRELIQLQMPDQSFVDVFSDELKMPADDANPEVTRRWLRKFGATAAAFNSQAAKVINRREVEYPYVCQYMTNGVELLPPNPERPKQLKNPWPGTSIPIITCYGKILWFDEGAGTKEAGEVIQEDGTGSTRKILSLIRLARDPAMLYSYIQTCKAEAIGGVPRSSWIGYEGQFRGHETQWQKANSEPVAYLEAKPTVEQLSQQLLPLPTKLPWDPPLQNLEISAESARRAIQAAMGIMPLPTSAQRQNEKSGIALERIKATSQQGSFHFVDHYEMSIAETGKKLDELLDDYYDAARDVTVRDAAGETETVRINDPNAPDQESKEPLMLTDDPYDVTLSTGPSYESEREQAQDFADTLVGNIQAIAAIAGPQAATQLMALTVKLRNLGPIGDEMAKMLSPDKGQEMTPEQAQEQLQKAAQMNDMLTQALEQATREKETEQVKADNAFKLEELKQRGAMQKLLKDTEIEMARLALENKKIEADLLKTRATLEQKQTENMIDKEIQQTNAAVALAGEQVEREAVSQEAEKDRQFQREEGAESRAFEAENAAADREAAAQQPAE